MNKINRIKKTQEFQKIIGIKRKLITDSYILYFNDIKEKYPRFGISVSKKHGCAVIRNKIKRQVKMMIQQNVDFKTFKYDCVIVVRLEYQKNDFKSNNLILKNLLDKL